MDTLEDQVEVLKKKVHIFAKLCKPIHVKFKRGYWKRGYILSESEDFFSLNEFRDGEMIVFFAEIVDIDEMRPREVENGTR